MQSKKLLLEQNEQAMTGQIELLLLSDAMFFGLVLSSMQPTKMPSLLNRYTSLPIALDVLCRKRITLLSPDTWEDRNDAYYLERYRVEMGM